MKGAHLALCESIMLETPPDAEQPQIQDHTLKLQDMTVAARPTINDTKSQELEEFLIEYRDISVMNNDDNR
jgi:hypothetical protein